MGSPDTVLPTHSPETTCRWPQCRAGLGSPLGLWRGTEVDSRTTGYVSMELYHVGSANPVKMINKYGIYRILPPTNTPYMDHTCTLLCNHVTVPSDISYTQNGVHKHKAISAYTNTHTHTHTYATCSICSVSKWLHCCRISVWLSRSR